jgi:branched-chain amino acid transport system ATP-binding protein
VAELLSVRGLTLAFGGLRALDDVDLAVAEGSIAGLIGPNGAGKTSLLNCICRFYRPQRGSILFDGVDLLRRPAHALAGLGLARTFQHMELFGPLTVLENVLVGAHTGRRPNMAGEAWALPGARRAERQMRLDGMALLTQLGLAAHAHVPARALPLGLQKRTGVARALACRPRLLLLDEPAGGLNASEKRELATLLRAVRDDLHVTILLIEHDMDLVMSLCESLTVLDFGRRIAEGSPAAVRRDPAVIGAYLGIEAAAPSLHGAR